MARAIPWRQSRTCSFTRDERGVTGPFTDLPALGIVAVGLIIFAYLMLYAYSSYASAAYYLGVRGDLRDMARAMACDPAFTNGIPGTLDAARLDNASGKSLAGYGYPGSTVQVAVESSGRRWTVGDTSHGRSAACQLPVSVRLSDARCVPGTMTVTMWEG